MARNAAAFLVLVLALAARPLTAAERDRLLVSTDWLAGRLADPRLVLLHVGDRAEYDAAHLPGARFVALRDVSAGPTGPGESAALRLEMLPAEELRRRLEALGISDDSHVVVYFGKDWVSPATRLVFTLDYAGLGANAKLLDGGQPAWVRAGRAVTAEVPASRAGNLSPLQLHSSIVDAKFVLEHLEKPGFALVDARDSGYYNGVETGGAPEHPHRTGHIAGARSLPFDTTTTDDLLWRSDRELRALFAGAGVAPGDTVITYCHIGQQATAVLFAARLLGFEVRLYDGSFEEWSRLAGHPVEKPPAAAVATAP
jgi:thiosulfate/3-mercaptopyruvate sulfurtransferase